LIIFYNIRALFKPLEQDLEEKTNLRSNCDQVLEKKNLKKDDMNILFLFLAASMPIVQVLLIGVIGAYLASGYSNILTACARKDMNKVI
jgi:hypothetical protein